MKKNILINATAMLLITTALNTAVFTTQANAQTAKNTNLSSSSSVAVGRNMLANAIDGKLLLKADVGYVYSFGGGWTKSGTGVTGDNQSTATGGFGYGVSLGYTNKSGWGVSADYLGFAHKWTGVGAGGQGNYNFDAPYHVMTVTPSYRFALDRANRWGLRLGLGLGFSLSDISWKAAGSPSGAASNGTKVAGGAAYSIGQGATVPNSGTGQANANCLGNGNFLAIDSNNTGFPASTPTNVCLDRTSGSPVRVAGSILTDAEIASLFAIDATADANGNARAGAAYNSGTVAQGVWSDNAIVGDATAFKNMLVNVGVSNRADDKFEANTGTVTIANNVWTNALNFSNNSVKGLVKLLSVVDATKTTFAGNATISYGGPNGYDGYASFTDAQRGLLVTKLGASATFGAVPDSAWAGGKGLTLGFTGATAPTLAYDSLSEATLKDKAKDANSLKTLLGSMDALKTKGVTPTVDQTIATPVTIDYSVYSQVTDAAQKTQLDALVATGKVAYGAAPAPAAGGTAKDDAGVVIAPQVALEYDNGMLHADVNVKYIHELVDVRYFGDEGSASGLKTSGPVTYTSKAGPLALFIGAGFGLNF